MNIYVNKYSINIDYCGVLKSQALRVTVSGRENPWEVGNLFHEDYPTKLQQDGWSGEHGVRMMHLNLTSMRWPRRYIRGWGMKNNNKICGSVSIVYKHYWFQQNRQGDQSLDSP